MLKRDLSKTLTSVKSGWSSGTRGPSFEDSWVVAYVGIWRIWPNLVFSSFSSSLGGGGGGVGWLVSRKGVGWRGRWLRTNWLLEVFGRLGRWFFSC